MLEKFKTIDIIVDGEAIKAPIVNNLNIRDIGPEMDNVAAAMGYWGNVLAAAIEDLDAADAVYRNWRARCVESILEEQKSLAEWKVKAKIDSSADFLEHKAKIARCQRNVNILLRVFLAFDKKANQLQSRGANLRSEYERTGIATRIRTDSEEDGEVRAKRKNKVKGIFSGRNKRAENTQE